MYVHDVSDAHQATLKCNIVRGSFAAMEQVFRGGLLPGTVANGFDEIKFSLSLLSWREESSFIERGRSLNEGHPEKRRRASMVVRNST
jgi:hypothetical protein